MTADKKPEPVAWMRLQDYLVFHDSGYTESATVLSNQWGNAECVPLYAASPARKWVGLTEEEINRLLDSFIDISAAIEAAEAVLKAKNT